MPYPYLSPKAQIDTAGSILSNSAYTRHVLISTGDKFIQLSR